MFFSLKCFHLFKLVFGQKSILNIFRTKHICNNIFPTWDIFTTFDISPTWDIFTTFGIFMGLINFDIITTRYCYDIDIITTRYCYDIDIITTSILLRHWYIVQGYNTTKGSYLSIQRYYCYSNIVPGELSVVHTNLCHCLVSSNCYNLILSFNTKQGINYTWYNNTVIDSSSWYIYIDFVYQTQT